jgi:hypothetical protein
VTQGGRGFVLCSGLSTPWRAFLLRVQHAGVVSQALSLEGIMSKRKDSPYRRPMKNPACTAVKPEEEEEGGR